MINTSFTDNIENHVSNWAWDFGDGNISNEQNPNHTYTTIGKYTVSLTVIGNGGTDTETKTDYITTYDPTGITSNRTDKFFKLYPNPTKLSCTISLTLEEAKNVKITASNSKGQIVDVIYIGFLSDNSHEFEINISDFPAGLYFISLNTDSFNSIQKLITEVSQVKKVSKYA